MKSIIQFFPVLDSRYQKRGGGSISPGTYYGQVLKWNGTTYEPSTVLSDVDEGDSIDFNQRQMRRGAGSVVFVWGNGVDIYSNDEQLALSANSRQLLANGIISLDWTDGIGGEDINGVSWGQLTSAARTLNDLTGVVSTNFDLRQLLNSAVDITVDWENQDLARGWTASGGLVIKGVPIDSNAATGYVGEYVENKVAVGSATAMTNNTTANITSISLTAGDWDVEGLVNIQATGGTFTSRSAGINVTSATIPTDGTESLNTNITSIAAITIPFPIPRKRVSVSATTTVYLVARGSFSAGTVSGYGFINARRVR